MNYIIYSMLQSLPADFASANIALFFQMQAKLAYFFFNKIH